MDIVLCIFIFTSILLEWVLFYSNFSCVTFVKSNANALLSAEPTKMRQSTIVCALAEGLFGYRRSVCCLWLHTPQTADIFQQKFRRLQWWRTLKIFSFSPICNPSLSFLNCLLSDFPPQQCLDINICDSNILVSVVPITLLPCLLVRFLRLIPETLL